MIFSHLNQTLLSTESINNAYTTSETRFTHSQGHIDKQRSPQRENYLETPPTNLDNIFTKQ